MTACETEKSVINCVCGNNGITCLPCGQDAVQGGTTTGGPMGQNCPHGVDSNTGECQPAPIVMNDTGPMDQEEVVPMETGPIPGRCDTMEGPKTKKIGLPCADHAECESCLCYDEGYLSPNRFCTKDCSTGPASACPLGSGQTPEYACLRFTQALINDYELLYDAICVPRCQNTSDCYQYGTSWTQCTEGDTKWDGATVQAASTCQ